MERRLLIAALTVHFNLIDGLLLLRQRDPEAGHGQGRGEGKHVPLVGGVEGGVIARTQIHNLIQCHPPVGSTRGGVPVGVGVGLCVLVWRVYERVLDDKSAQRVLGVGHHDGVAGAEGKGLHFDFLRE